MDVVTREIEGAVAPPIEMYERIRTFSPNFIQKSCPHRGPGAPTRADSSRPRYRSKKSRSRKFCRERMRFAPPYSKRTQIGRHQWMTYCLRHDKC